MATKRSKTPPAITAVIENEIKVTAADLADLAYDQACSEHAAASAAADAEIKRLKMAVLALSEDTLERYFEQRKYPHNALVPTYKVQRYAPGRQHWDRDTTMDQIGVYYNAQMPIGSADVSCYVRLSLLVPFEPKIEELFGQLNQAYEAKLQRDKANAALGNKAEFKRRFIRSAIQQTAERGTKPQEGSPA